MSRLWNVEDQTARLAELTSRDRDLKEAPLRRDVRSLGRLLGEVLKETGWRQVVFSGRRIAPLVD